MARPNEEKPPLYRFVETSIEDRIASEEAGITQYMDVVKVYVRTPGDQRTEFVDFARQTAYDVVEAEIRVEKEHQTYKKDLETGEIKPVTEVITIPEIRRIATKKIIYPRMSKLQDRLKNDQISPEYVDHYVRAWERFLKNEDEPITGTPLVDWRGAPESVKRRAIEIGVRSIEEAADMDDATVNNIGMGGRDLQNRARIYLDQDNSALKSGQEMKSLKESNLEMAQQLTAMQSKLAELSAGERDPIPTDEPEPEVKTTIKKTTKKAKAA